VRVVELPVSVFNAQTQTGQALRRYMSQAFAIVVLFFEKLAMNKANQLTEETI